VLAVRRVLVLVVVATIAFSQRSLQRVAEAQEQIMPLVLLVVLVVAVERLVVLVAQEIRLP
jgi:uncharacterized membrane protein